MHCIQLGNNSELGHSPNFGKVFPFELVITCTIKNGRLTDIVFNQTKLLFPNSNPTGNLGITSNGTISEKKRGIRDPLGSKQLDFQRHYLIFGFMGLNGDVLETKGVTKNPLVAKIT